MSNLTDLLPAGAGGKQVDFVATGTIGNGVTVALKTDGTVSVISESAAVLSSAVDPAGTNGVGNSYFTTSSDWNPNTNKVIVGIINNVGGAGIIYCGVVSGTTITFGGGYNAAAEPANVLDVKWDLNQTDVFVYINAYQGFYYFGNAFIGKVSGTTVTQAPSGAGTTFASWDPDVYGNPIRYMNLQRNANTGKLVVFYATPDNFYYGTAKVITVTGTTNISAGSATVFNSATTSNFRSSDSNTSKVVVSYYDASGNQFKVGTISGTSISFGAAATLFSGGFSYGAIAYSPVADKFLAAPRESSALSGQVFLGTISGTSITFGSGVVYDATGADYTQVNYNSGNNTFQISYRAVNSSSYLKSVTATVNGDSVSVSTPYTIESNSTSQTTSVYAGSSDVFIIGYRVTSTARFNVKTYRPSSTNYTDFIGISDAAISDTASGSVTIKGGISSNVTGLTANSTYYVQADGSLGSPTVSIPYDIVGSTYVQSFSVSAQETNPQGVAFNADGTKMFVIGNSSDNVNEYALTTGFDVSTASFTDAFSVAAQEIDPNGLAFNTDGTKMFVVGNTGDAVFEYALSTGFDVSTASFTDSFSVGGQENFPTAIAFNTNGTKMFIVGTTGDSVYEYALTTGFDVSTASYSQSFSVTAQETTPQGLAFSTDGTKMFVVGYTDDNVNKYALTTGFDVSTASFTDSFSVAAQENLARGLAFNTDGTKMFVVGSSGDAVYEYSTGVGSVTTVLAGKALSATSINLDYTT